MCENKNYWGIYDLDSNQAQVKWFNDNGQRRSKLFWRSSNSIEKIQQFYDKMIDEYDQQNCRDLYREHCRKFNEKSRNKQSNINTRQERFQ